MLYGRATGKVLLSCHYMKVVHKVVPVSLIMNIGQQKWPNGHARMQPYTPQDILKISIFETLT